MTPSTFPQDLRPGDIVRCLHADDLPDSSALKKGALYAVQAVTARRPFIGYLVLEEMDGGWLPTRFERVPAASNPVAEAMAAVMREQAAQAGACTLDDLARAGFTSAEIIEYADDARAIAGPPSALEAA